MRPQAKEKWCDSPEGRSKQLSKLDNCKQAAIVNVEIKLNVGNTVFTDFI